MLVLVLLLLTVVTALVVIVLAVCERVAAWPRHGVMSGLDYTYAGGVSSVLWGSELLVRCG